MTPEEFKQRQLTPAEEEFHDCLMKQCLIALTFKRQYADHITPEEQLIIEQYYQLKDRMKILDRTIKTQKQHDQKTNTTNPLRN